MERVGGPKAEIRLDRWPVIQADFLAGRLDAVAMTATGARRQWALFGRSHATPATGIYHRQGFAAPVALADLENRSIAMSESSEPMRQTRETFLAGDSYRFLLLPDERAALQAVGDGRADYALMSRAYGDAILAAGALPGVVASDYNLRLQAYGFAVAHDLRAPLRSVGGFSALVREDLDAGESALAIERTHYIDQSVKRMDQMIEALTRLARSGRTALERGPLDMATAAREAWRLIAAASPERRVDFAVAALPLAEGDFRMLGQVWQNLLDNAWKYTAKQPHARITIDSFEEGGRIWYRVSDNGAGFDMARAQHLFQPFHRMHADSEFAGTGVGLSIVRRIVEAHGGSIRARSSPQTGTVMEFTLAAAVN